MTPDTHEHDDDRDGGRDDGRRGDPAADGAAAAPRPVREFSSDMLADDPHHGRIDFERGMSYVAPATLAVIAIASAIFGWQVATGGLDSDEALVNSGALVAARLARGEVWRLVSSMFLHGGLDHLLGNMVALYILGLACEHAFGGATMLAIYAAAGIVGGLASAAVEPLPTVGASGAIFGLMGCAVAMLARRRGRLHVRDGRIGFVLACWAAWQLWQGFANPLVANMAHVGGLVAGMIIGWIVEPRLLVTREAGDTDAWPTSAAPRDTTPWP